MPPRKPIDPSLLDGMTTMELLHEAYNHLNEQGLRATLIKMIKGENPAEVIYRKTHATNQTHPS